jgi:hypothetical protein
MPTRRVRARTTIRLVVLVSMILVQWNSAQGAAGQSGAIPPPAPDARGLFLTAEAQLGILPPQPLYWHIYEYTSRAAAEAVRGERGTAAEVFGRHWLYTIAEEKWRPAAGVRIAVIGPLDVATDTPYTARYMEALFPWAGPQPYGDGSGHRHPGPEAWYVVSGAQCLETPNGLIVASAGGGAMVPEGWPMAIASAGEETRRALVLILHRSSEPYSMAVDGTSRVPGSALSDHRSHGAPHSDWKPQGLCARWRR